MEEVWKDVPEWEGIYQVSNMGRARSLDREIETKNGSKRKYTGSILFPAVSSTGHNHMTLSRGGYIEKDTLHRVIMRTFVGPCPEGMEVRHLDDNPQNNRLDNLAYGTRSENLYDRVSNGIHSMSNKKNCKRGHPLVDPNLRKWQKDRGWRGCLACHKASLYKHYNDVSGEEEFKNIADGFYGKIMASIEPREAH